MHMFLTLIDVARVIIYIKGAVCRDVMEPIGYFSGQLIGVSTACSSFGQTCIQVSLEPGFLVMKVCML